MIHKDIKKGLFYDKENNVYVYEDVYFKDGYFYSKDSNLKITKVLIKNEN